MELIMKKSLIILLMLVLLVSGCESKKETSDTITSSTTTSTTTTKETTDVSETSITTTTIESTTTTKKTTTTKATTTACRAKVFDKSYTYVYETESECQKQGNTNFLYVSDYINSKVFVYNCRKITDECGTVWYGVYFMVYNTDTNKKEEFNY